MRIRRKSRREMEEEMDEEFRFHLQMEIDQNLKSGMSPREARRQAHLSFGGIDVAKESVREEWKHGPGLIHFMSRILG